MGKHKSQDCQISSFQLEGRFLRLDLEDGYKLKWLWLATAEGEYCIKLSKEARASVGRVLVPGEWLEISGEKKVDRMTGEVKWRATFIRTSMPRPLDESVVAKPPSVKPKASILVCQKSDCMKRGGRAVCRALETALSDRGLTDQVVVKGTGCMKHCKAGPNVVVMPDKTRYSQIGAEAIPALIDQHFSQKAIVHPIERPMEPLRR
ncbi:MAG: (2Fe-2S) ferredoxin domain-containing protein [Scytolyngbya sp. HA4215-MV1]|jgi:(2Fe-2S) ferredoxin|nr:(2Fe-2S) ferredoxin domain-containing protein [Scytolyngbya sp. HA4215-MV1]